MTPSECPACDAERQRRNAEQQQQNAEIRAAEAAARERARFEAVIPKLYRDARIEHLSPALQEQILGLDDERGLFLWGPVGVGKTYAKAAIARHFIEARQWVERVVWGKMLYDIRKTFHYHDDDESTVLNPLLTADKVIIEDIGTAASLDKQESDFATRTLLMVLDSRIEDCLPVFITSNLSIESLGRSFDERIASRIQGCCEVIELQGRDRRRGAKIS